MQGYAVRTAADAAELDTRLAEAPTDVIVLDINMPGENGLAALARLRAAGSQAGVVLLTAAGDARRPGGRARGRRRRLRGEALRAARALGAICAVLRRLDTAGVGAPEPTAPPKPPLRWGAAPSIPRRAACAMRTGAEIALTAMEFDLLEVFSRHPRQVLSRSRLAQAGARPAAGAGRPLDRHPHHPPARQDRRGRPHARGHCGRCMARARSSTQTPEAQISRTRADNELIFGESRPQLKTKELYETRPSSSNQDMHSPATGA